MFYKFSLSIFAVEWNRINRECLWIGFLGQRSKNKKMSQRERIIEQSMQMFVAQGIKSVRMDDIAQQLGVSKRTLYELFGDKEELIYEAMVCFFERNLMQCEELCAEAPNVLEAMFIVLTHLMDHAEVSARMTDNVEKFYPAVYEKLLHEGREKNRLRFRAMLEQGISDGLFIPDIHIDLAITVLYYTSSALMRRRDLIIPEGVSEREAFVQVISNFFRGISTPCGAQLVADYLDRYQPAKDKKLF